MRVSYSKVMALLYVGLGALIVALSLVIRGPTIGMFPGITCAGIGVAFWFRPYFKVSDTEVVVFAPLSPIKKRYPYTAGGIRLVDGRLWADDKKTVLRRWMADNAEWDALQGRILADKFS